MPSRLELNVSLPSDVRFLSTVREIVVHAAKHAGCSDAQAQALGKDVESRVNRDLAAGEVGGSIPVMVRWGDGPVEVVVNGRPVSIDP